MGKKYIYVFVGTFASEEEFGDYCFSEGAFENNGLVEQATQEPCIDNLAYTFGSKVEILDDVKCFDYSSSFFDQLKIACSKKGKFNSLVYFIDQEVALNTKKLQFVGKCSYDSKSLSWDDVGANKVSGEGKISIWWGAIDEKILDIYVQERIQTDEYDGFRYRFKEQFKIDFEDTNFDFDLLESYLFPKPKTISFALGKTGFSKSLKSQIKERASKMKMEKGNALISVSDYDFLSYDDTRPKSNRKGFKFIGVFDLE